MWDKNALDVAVNRLSEGAEFLVDLYMEAIEAAMRADKLLVASDLDGYAVWKRILGAVEELQGTVPKSGEAVH